MGKKYVIYLDLLLFIVTDCRKLFPTCLPVGIAIRDFQDNQVGLEMNGTRRLLVHMGGANLLSENVNVVIKTHDFWLLIRSFGEKQITI